MSAVKQQTCIILNCDVLWRETNNIIKFKKNIRSFLTRCLLYGKLALYISYEKKHAFNVLQKTLTNYNSRQILFIAYKDR